MRKISFVFIMFGLMDNFLHRDPFMALLMMAFVIKYFMATKPAKVTA